MVEKPLDHADDESEDVGEKEELEDDMAILEAKVAELQKELQYSQAEMLTLGKED